MCIRIYIFNFKKQQKEKQESKKQKELKKEREYLRKIENTSFVSGNAAAGVNIFSSAAFP